MSHLSLKPKSSRMEYKINTVKALKSPFKQLHLNAVTHLNAGTVFRQDDETVGFRHRAQHARPLIADSFYLLFAVDRNNPPAQVFAAPGLLPDRVGCRNGQQRAHRPGQAEQRVEHKLRAAQRPRIPPGP